MVGYRLAGVLSIPNLKDSATVHGSPNIRRVQSSINLPHPHVLDRFSTLQQRPGVNTRYAHSDVLSVGRWSGSTFPWEKQRGLVEVHPGLQAPNARNLS